MNKDINNLKNKLILNYEVRIRELTTRLAFTEGFLSTRGVMEKFERTRCNTFYLTNRSRKDRWTFVFKTDPEFKQTLLNELRLTNQSDEELAYKITDLYESLSIKIHTPVQSSDALIICSDISIADTKIIACICNNLNIIWKSDLVEEDLYVKKRVNLNLTQ